MVAATLEARLTLRLLGTAGAVLVAVGVSAVVVTARVLDAGDTAAARAEANAAREAVQRERAEGDSLDDAVAEVVAAARAEGVRVAVRRAGAGSPDAANEDDLPSLPAGSCASLDDARGQPWRACASTSPAQADRAGPGARAFTVAAVPVGPHRAAVRALARGMAAVVALALLVLAWAVRRALRGPADELTSLVGWTERIIAAESAIDPPLARTREIARLEAAFGALVRRLLEALARERATTAHVAHELRTPLTAMTAELDALRPGDEAACAAVARVRGDAARLADVIEAILVLSDGARSARTAARADTIVNVADLVRGLVPSGVVVEAPDEALIEGDERLVSLAARNLVENARKHGGGVRRVRISRDAAAIRLAVLDDGPGLDEPARGRMFDRYWRGAGDGDGSGLGLALVRAVAERHGGQADARLGPDGRGLEVGITFGRCVGWHE
ncbi:MAG: HAMP domain-containing histidine kinase [Myxococcales bacterium]|nr:HAMP domain-containing histidine kinase [Myxococcales bacterium]